MAKSPTIEDLEEQRRVIGLQIAQTELPQVQKALDWLNSEEVVYFCKMATSLQEGLSMNSTANALAGIISSVNVARQQMQQRITAHQMMIQANQ